MRPLRRHVEHVSALLDHLELVAAFAEVVERGLERKGRAVGRRERPAPPPDEQRIVRRAVKVRMGARERRRDGELLEGHAVRPHAERCRRLAQRLVKEEGKALENLPQTEERLRELSNSINGEGKPSMRMRLRAKLAGMRHGMSDLTNKMDGTSITNV